MNLVIFFSHYRIVIFSGIDFYQSLSYCNMLIFCHESNSFLPTCWILKAVQTLVSMKVTLIEREISYCRYVSKKIVHPNFISLYNFYNVINKVIDKESRLFFLAIILHYIRYIVIL